MKKHLLLLLIVFTYSLSAQYALKESTWQLNAGFGFSSWGLPIYVGVDYGVAKDISVGGEFSYRSYGEDFGGSKFDHTIIGISANGNYHFNSVLNIPTKWDVYAGLNLGFYTWSSPSGYGGSGNGGLGLGLQLGARYYFNPAWAVNLEFGGGNAFSGGKIGVSHIF